LGKTFPGLGFDFNEKWLSMEQFVMMGHVEAFLKLIRHSLPYLYRSFEAVRLSLFSSSEKDALRRLYSALPNTAFADEVLSSRPSSLAVLRAVDLGWSDLGKPNRVLSVLKREGLQADWAFPAGREESTGNAAKSASAY
jgi:hypothetical protein